VTLPLELDELELAPCAPLSPPAPHEWAQTGEPPSAQFISGGLHTQLSCEQTVPGMAEQSDATMH
jgi:hypothetical protein